MTDTDKVRCPDCGALYAKDDTIKVQYQDNKAWFCEDCYAKRTAEIEGYAS